MSDEADEPDSNCIFTYITTLVCACLVSRICQYHNRLKTSNLQRYEECCLWKAEKRNATVTSIIACQK